MATDFVKSMMLLVIFLVAGAVCGIMINLSLDRKYSELGGIMGGLVVGAMMWLL